MGLLTSITFVAYENEQKQRAIRNKIKKIPDIHYIDKIFHRV